MRLTLPTPTGPVDLDLDRLAPVLKPADHVPYAPPHVYPMAAPKLGRQPEADRHRPAGDRLGVYVHIPFCNYTCNFCFYAKKVADGRAEMERYVAALGRELAWVRPGTRLTHLYVGGGTPTALPADLLDRVLGAVLGRMRREGESVHTVECSPESLTDDHVRVITGHGIGRISIGIQSLDDAVLGQLGRRHTGAVALAACDRLVATGRIVNVDLIYGLPGQTEAMFARDLAAVAGRGIHSVTAYNLRVNERTPVLQLLKPDERLELDRLARWRSAIACQAAELGLVQGHWQVFERPGLGFVPDYSFGDQLGVGVSARSRLDQTVYRNHAGLAAYLERVESGRSPVEEVFRLQEADRKTRFIGLTLGSGQALDRRAYEREFGTPFDEDYGASLTRLSEAGLVEDTDGAVTLSASGKLFYDLVTLALYPRPVREWLAERYSVAVERRTPREADRSTVADRFPK